MHQIKGGFLLTPEVELLGVMLQVFPSFRALPPAEQAARTEALGFFLAQGWGVGAQRLRQHGFDVTDAVVSGVMPASQYVVQAKRGGATFLVQLRQAMSDDARFQKLLLALGALYARSRPPSAGTASGRYPAVAPGSKTTSGAFVAATLPPDPAPAPAPAAAAPPPAPRPAKPSSGDLLDELDFTAATGERPAAPAPASAKISREVKVVDAGEGTGSFDASMLADLEGTLNDSPAAAKPAAPGRPTPAPVPSAQPDLGGLDDLDSPVSAPPLETVPTAATGTPAAAAPASNDFLSSLVGGGLKQDAGLAPPPASAPPKPSIARPSAPRVETPRLAPTPAPAAPPAPTPGAPPPKSNPGWSSFDLALKTGGPIFKDEADGDAEPAPPPKPAPSPRPEPKKEAPKPKPPSGSGELDLMPEEPAKAAEDARMDALLDELPAPLPKAPEPKTSRPSGRFKSTTMRVQEFSLEEEAENAPPVNESPETEGESEEELPKDPAQAALVRYERTGDPAALNEARKIFTETVQAAPHGTARAYAEAGLAKVQLLAGNAPQAEQTARQALERDPGNPFAVEVIVRVMRGEAERSRLAAGLAQARNLIGNSRAAEARRLLEQKLAVEHPDCPQPWLLAAFLAKLEGDDARFERCVHEAWQRYPGKKHVDLPLGGTVDVDLATVIAAHGRQRFKTLDPEFLRQTIENPDSKDNKVAGLFRVAIACARVGIAKGHLGRKSVRKGYIAIAAALIGLQYYDAAAEALDRAGTLRPDENETKAIDVERRFAGQMRRAFDKPGVKAQLGKYTCPGAQAVASAARERLAAATKDKADRTVDLLKAATEMAKVCAEDANVREEVRAAAAALQKPDPIEAFELADAELHAVRDERARLADPNKASSSERKGFLSKLAGAASAAADKVASTAKDAQLKVREMQVSARREEAVKKLGITIAKELREHAWTSSQLKHFAKRAASYEAFVDYHAEEERQAKGELETVGKAV